jgi:8-oxo-dGTP diphosphatase
MVYTSEFPIISVTVDAVCLADREGDVHVLLVERGGEPFAGRLAFPGGFVEIDEDLPAAAARELAEETGIELSVPLEQLRTYGAPGRDPRGRTVTTAYLAVVPQMDEPVGGSDAAAAGWHRVDDVLAAGRLAFDHAEILRDALAHAGRAAGASR